MAKKEQKKAASSAEKFIVNRLGKSLEAGARKVVGQTKKK